MLDLIPLRPASAVAWDTLQALAERIPPLRWLSSAIGLGQAPAPRPGVPVYVMLPLDAALPEPELAEERFEAALHALKAAGAKGVMCDVWWGVCEPTPGQYDFSAYVKLFKLCRDAGLRVQATMSFHACGGNVGDSVCVPLPDWVVEAGDEHAFWFTDRSGGINREYISFGADHKPLLPGVKEQSEKVEDAAEQVVGEDGEPAVVSPQLVAPVRLRTPLQAYQAFVKAFVNEMMKEELFGTTITEVQMGVGPCGELRYPSYPMDKWAFPGIGELQCFDKFLLADLEAAMRENGSDEVKGANMPPEDTGWYNDSPGNAEFWRNGFQTEAGEFFLAWYSRRMLQHAEDVLGVVRDVLPAGGGVDLAVKVAGIHWWKFSRSRAAEAAAGYIVGSGRTAYGDVARMLRAFDAVLDFTCLEMRTIDQPFLKARCGPRQLVAEVFREAEQAGVAVAGENALERFDWGGLSQVVSAFRRCRARRVGFTLLRLGAGLLEEDNMRTFERFVKAMKEAQ